eukprot:2017825-Lingulodinium_polyedra.AAC.1
MLGYKTPAHDRRCLMPTPLRNLLPPTRQSQAISRACAGHLSLTCWGTSPCNRIWGTISATKPRAGAH